MRKVTSELAGYNRINVVEFSEIANDPTSHYYGTERKTDWVCEFDIDVYGRQDPNNEYNVELVAVAI